LARHAKVSVKCLNATCTVTVCLPECDSIIRILVCIVGGVRVTGLCNVNRRCATNRCRLCICLVSPQVRQDYPLNLSISVNGGKETNKDSHSSCERRGKSPALESVPVGYRDVGFSADARREGSRLSGPEWPDMEGEIPVRWELSGKRGTASQIVWDCSLKWVVDSI